MMNGHWQDDPETLTVAGLLERLSLEPKPLAVALDQRLIRRAGRIPRKLYAATSSPLEGAIGAKDSE